MNGHDVAPGVETAIIRKDKKKKSRDEMCVIYVWDRNMSGFVAAISSREIDRSEKKKRISGGVPVGCQSLDEQIILPSNFHRDSFDHRILSSIPPPYFYLSIYFFDIL